LMASNVKHATAPERSTDPLAVPPKLYEQARVPRVALGYKVARIMSA
jgi:hypothetical protein